MSLHIHESEVLPDTTQCKLRRSINGLSGKMKSFLPFYSHTCIIFTLPNCSGNHHQITQSLKVSALVGKRLRCKRLVSILSMSLTLFSTGTNILTSFFALQGSSISSSSTAFVLWILFIYSPWGYSHAPLPHRWWPLTSICSTSYTKCSCEWHQIPQPGVRHWNHFWEWGNINSLLR